jgi:hypothetical protein
MGLYLMGFYLIYLIDAIRLVSIDRALLMGLYLMGFYLIYLIDAI